MREFQEIFEELGYTFQSRAILQDVYTFYKFYDNSANKGVASILLEGDPGSGKTFLSEIFSKFLGNQTEYIYTQCVDETNSDRLIATYNVPAIVKGDADRSIAEGILTRSINLANSGKKVVLTIDELDKARETLDSYFLDFLQSGKIETSDNQILSLSKEGRKNLYVILAKNDERKLLDALLSRCSVIQLPPMPPVLAYKTLLKIFERAPHDAKFLKFVSKVYEAIYNEQMNSGEELLTRLPALRELISAISSDNVLYEEAISSTDRINKLIRNLGKDTESREVITDILVRKFRYQNKESNYNNNDVLNFDLNDTSDYMDNKDPNSLIEQYMEKKETGEYIFEEENDAMSDIANILDNMSDDQTLVFLNKEDKEKIVELGTIIHSSPRALQMLFDKIRFKGNPNSKFGFLDFEGDNFIGLMKYKQSLILIANKEYISPRLFIRGLCTIIKIIYDANENTLNDCYFSPHLAKDFKLTSLNAKILSHIPKISLNKMNHNNGSYEYQTSNLKIIYNENESIDYFNYLEKFNAQPIYEVIEKLCKFNPELAIPASFINAKKFNTFTDKHLVRKKEELERYQERLYKKEGWNIEISEFPIMTLKFTETKTSKDYWSSEPEYEYEYVERDYVFDWVEEENRDNKTIKVYPKYQLKDDYLLYTNDKDFENQKELQLLNSFQKEIAFLARDIFGNFILEFGMEGSKDFFSSLTMSTTGRIVEDENYRKRVLGISHDITIESDFKKYYDSLSTASSTIVTPNKVMKRVSK